MGAWGTGIFENDDASDWVAQLGGSRDLGLVRGALSAATSAEYLDAPTSSVALVAAEVVAALSGRTAPDMPDDLRAWVDARRAVPPAELLTLALRAVDRVTAGSELAELWQASDDPRGWQMTVEDLRARLSP